MFFHLVFFSVNSPTQKAGQQEGTRSVLGRFSGCDDERLAGRSCVCVSAEGQRDLHPGALRGHRNSILPVPWLLSALPTNGCCCSDWRYRYHDRRPVQAQVDQRGAGHGQHRAPAVHRLGAPRVLFLCKRCHPPRAACDHARRRAREGRHCAARLALSDGPALALPRPVAAALARERHRQLRGALPLGHLRELLLLWLRHGRLLSNHLDLPARAERPQRQDRPLLARV